MIIYLRDKIVKLHVTIRDCHLTYMNASLTERDECGGAIVETEVHISVGVAPLKATVMPALFCFSQGASAYE